jgi:alkylation response protein AidB-like acyl-CoA dehydrogenase
MNFYSDESEWKYLFRNAIDWDTIIPLYYTKFPTEDGFNNKEEVIDFLEELVTSTGDWTGNSLAPRARELDETGAGKVENGVTIPSAPLQKTYDEATELQFFGLTADPEYGGLGVPVATGMVSFTQVNRACVSTATQMGFFTSIIDMIERFCEKEDCERLIPQIISGKLSGSMCLTEPGAGSDVGSLKTTAEKMDNGLYKLNGAKLFISNGGGGLGFALARIKGAPEGLNGISLFLVEQHRDDVEGLNYTVTKTEEKMGLHGSFTCEVVYENSVAKLIGKEHQGFRYMLHLMNEARIGVGLQALGGIEASLAYARQYAEQRVQFGKPITELPLFKRNLEDWETERDAIRCLMVDTLNFYDIYQKLDLKKRHGGELTDQEENLFKEAMKWTRRRTPLVKYYGSESFTYLSQCGIQALGGYGFIKEYDAERFHRDSFAPLLYEGTSQIQALMAMKDLMKVVTRSPGKFFQSIAGGHPLSNLFTKETEFEREFHGLQYDFKKKLSFLIVKCLKPEADLGNFNEVSKFFNAKNYLTEENFNKLMTHAETICQGLSYLETLRVLSQHATKDKERGDLFFRYLTLVKPRFEAIFTDWKIR